MLGLPRTWRRTHSSPRSSNGRSQACRTIRAPGSWPPQSGVPLICSAEIPFSSANTRSLVASLDNDLEGGSEIPVAYRQLVDDGGGSDARQLRHAIKNPMFQRDGFWVFFVICRRSLQNQRGEVIRLYPRVDLQQPIEALDQQSGAHGASSIALSFCLAGGWC